MPRLQVLILWFVVSFGAFARIARADYPVRVVGTLVLVDRTFRIVVYRGTQNETVLRIRARAPLVEFWTRFAQRVNERVTVTGTMAHPPIDQSGEISTEPALITPSVANHFLPDEGDGITRLP